MYEIFQTIVLFAGIIAGVYLISRAADYCAAARLRAKEIGKPVEVLNLKVIRFCVDP